MSIDSSHPETWPRSYLFVPGDRPERFDAGWASSADAVILDLEDAVAPDNKAIAREAVARWLSPDRPVWIRMNAVETEWFRHDLSLLRETVGIAGVVCSKAETLPAALLDVTASRRIAIMALIETAAGIHRVNELAATPGVSRLAFGSIDFQVDMGIEDDDQALLLHRSQLVLASRLASLPPPADGVTVAISDLDAVRSDTLRSRRLGFGAKLSIHPRQIETIHEVLSPSEEERDWAQRVVSAMEASSGAAVKVDGRMVDRPVLLRAQRIAASPEPGDKLRG